MKLKAFFICCLIGAAPIALSMNTEVRQEQIGRFPEDVWIIIFEFVGQSATDISLFTNEDLLELPKFLWKLASEIKHHKDQIALAYSCRILHNKFFKKIALIPMLESALQQHNRSLSEIINEDKQTALHWACGQAHLTILNIIIAVGDTVTKDLLLQTDRDGWTALHNASAQKNTIVVKTLLNNAGSFLKLLLLKEDRFKQTALYIARSETTNDGQSARQIAASKAIKCLLEDALKSCN